MRYEMLFIFFAILFGCNPKAVEPIVEPNPCQPYQPCDTMVVWKMPYNDDTSLVVSHHMETMLIRDGKLLYSIEAPITTPDIVRLLDVGTQELIWEWKDYIPGTNGGFSSYEVIDDKYLYLNSNHEHYCIDLETGHTVWKNQESGGDYLTSHFGDKIFHFKRFGGWHAYPDSSVMYMSDIHDGVWQPIFKTRKDSDGYSSTLKPPSVYLDSQGDTILIFQDRRGRSSPMPRFSTELYAYNLTQKAIQWRVKNIAPTDVSNAINPPVLDLENKRVYFLTRFTVFCLDLETGVEIWKVPLDYAGVVSGNYFLADGKLITKTDQGYLIAFNASTGSRVYYEKMGGCCVENIKVVGDRIYFTDQALFVADVRTGKQKWKYYGWGDFSGGVAVDEANDVMYSVGSQYLYALEKPKY